MFKDYKNIVPKFRLFSKHSNPSLTIQLRMIKCHSCLVRVPNNSVHLISYSIERILTRSPTLEPQMAKGLEFQIFSHNFECRQFRASVYDIKQKSSPVLSGV